MEFVQRVKYEDSNGKTRDPEEIPTWKAGRILIEFRCPVCGCDREDAFSAPLSVDARSYCDSCKTTYFVRRPTKKHESPKIKTLIEEQLYSNSIVHPLVENDAEVSLLLATRVQTVLFSGVSVFIGTVGTIYGIISLFPAGGIATQLGLISILTGAIIGTFGVIFGGLRATLRGYNYYRKEKPSNSFIEFIRHVGRYYHEEPFRLT